MGEHKTRIGGTNYSLKKSLSLINGTNHKIIGGKTKINNTNYNIVFEPDWLNPTIITPVNGSTEICFKDTPIFYNGYYYGLSTTSQTTSNYSNAYLQVSTNLSSYTQKGGLGQSNGLHLLNGKLLTRTSVRPTSSTDPGNTMYIYYGTPNGTSTSMSNVSFQVTRSNYRDLGFEAEPYNFIYYNGNYYCMFKQVTSSYKTYLTSGKMDSNFANWQDNEPSGGHGTGESSDDDFYGLYLGSDKIFYLHFDDSANSGKRGTVRYYPLTDITSWPTTSNWSFSRLTNMDKPMYMWQIGTTYYIAGSRYKNASGNRLSLASSTDGINWTQKYISDVLSQGHNTNLNYCKVNYINNKLIYIVGTYGQTNDTSGIDIYISEDLDTTQYYHIDTPAGHTLPGTPQFDGYSYYFTAGYLGITTKIIKF